MFHSPDRLIVFVCGLGGSLAVEAIRASAQAQKRRPETLGRRTWRKVFRGRLRLLIAAGTAGLGCNFFCVLGCGFFGGFHAGEVNENGSHLELHLLAR